MSDQLAAGLVLAAVAATSTTAGLRWLAVAAVAAAIPFLVVGVLLAVDGSRARHERAPGRSR